MLFIVEDLETYFYMPNQAIVNKSSPSPREVMVQMKNVTYCKSSQFLHKVVCIHTYNQCPAICIQHGHHTAQDTYLR